MKNRRDLIRGIIATCAMFAIILDTRTAITSATEGVALCIRTIIPSLFPFFVLAGVINSCLCGQRIRILQPVCRLCRIPKGTESLLLLGFLAGYPVGAQLITQAYHNKRISKSAAHRMLGFCNNPGPAFLFGILTPLFTSAKAVWILWGILIVSALITGYILPSEETTSVEIETHSGTSFSESLQKSIKVTADICGWIILFRILIGFCNRWFLWLFPQAVQILFSGLLELSNGSVLLQSISNEGTRFLLSGFILTFGGLCVAMQTISVTEGLGTGWYFPGKAFQAVLSVFLCYWLQPILFDITDIHVLPFSVVIGLAVCTLLLGFVLCRKKLWLFQGDCSIIQVIKVERSKLCCSVKK